MPDLIKAKSLMDYNTLILPRLNKLCEPLTLFGISNFAYGKITKDGRFFRIGTHEKYTDLFFNHDIYNLSQANLGLAREETFSKAPQTRISIWGTNQKTPYGNMRLAAGMWNGVTFYNITPDYIEAWAVGGTPEDTQLLDFYANNMDLLHKFVAYFKQNAKDIVDISDRNKTIDITFHEPKPNALGDYSHKIEEFNRRITPKTLHLLGLNGEFTLSPRETECLFHKSQGLTAKEIAILCSLSPRTVETYIHSIKEKSGCKNMNQVLSLLNTPFK